MSGTGVVNGMSLRWTGACADLAPADRRALFDRVSTIDAANGERTASILARVRSEGDDGD